MRKKQRVSVVVHRDAVIARPQDIAPFEVRKDVYQGVRVLVVEFTAFDCYFAPGGNVAVTLRNRNPVIFRNQDVLEIRNDGHLSAVNKNLCPKCHYVSLRRGSQGFAPQTPVLMTLSCSRRGCKWHDSELI